MVRLAYEMRLVETGGTGIRLIYESCEKEAILAFMKLKPSISAQELADYLSTSRNTAIRKLNKLVASSQISKIGQGPAVRYKRH